MKTAAIFLIGLTLFAGKAWAAKGDECSARRKALVAAADQYLADQYLAKKNDDNPTKRIIGKEGRRTGGRVFVIAHGPNGEVLRNPPVDEGFTDITERDAIRLVAIIPPDGDVEFKVTECDAVPWYRLLHVEGQSPAQAQEKTPDDKTKKKIVEEPLMRAQFYDIDLRCATRLKYTVKITLPGCEAQAKTVEHTFPTQPVYDFFLGAGVGFDFGSPAEYSAQSRLKSDGTTEKILVRTSDQTGFKPVITLTQFPFGLNLARKDCRWWEVPAPFIALDPTRVDKGALAGIQWTIGRASGIMTGVSVFKTQKLSSPVGLSPGSVIPDNVSLSTRDTFNSDSVGFFVGANFTTDVLQQFLTAAGSALNVSGSAAAAKK